MHKILFKDLGINNTFKVDKIVILVWDTPAINDTAKNCPKIIPGDLGACTGGGGLPRLPLVFPF